MYDGLPDALGLGTPAWWPVPVLVVGGLLVALTIRFLPGTGGEVPAEGFKAGGGPAPASYLPGIALAALLTLGSGAVLGPEAPLIALGGGLGARAIRSIKHDAPARGVALIGAAVSFAAISTLLGSCLPAAFLLMEIAGIGGAMTSRPAGPGSAGRRHRGPDLRRPGLGDRARHGVAVPSRPPRCRHPTVAEFGWALVIGVLATLFGTAIRRSAQAVAPLVEHRPLVW